MAFGAGWGDLGVGIGGATQPGSGGQHYDGSASIVGGIGNPDKYVGLEAGLNIISLRDSGAGDSFAHDGNMAFKFHSNLPGEVSVGVGVENVVRWGKPKTGDPAKGIPPTRSSVYGVGTRIFDLNPGGSNKLPLAVNLGVGNHRFTSSGKGSVGAFGGVALLPLPSLSLIADWTGPELNAGVSWAPLPRWPLTVSLGAANVTSRRAGHPEFAGGIGYGFHY
ncbi:MAG TPA: hypothetical protein VHE37_11040 [Nevskiaceae bacterium]|nr:hypothetical protein [Nevskiaceae bacterium]